MPNKEKALQRIDLGHLSLAYDKQGRLWYLQKPQGGCIYRIYDHRDLLVGVVNERGEMTETIYDAHGNVLQSIGYVNTLSKKQSDFLALGYNSNIAVLRPQSHVHDRRIVNHRYTNPALP